MFVSSCLALTLFFALCSSHNVTDPLRRRADEHFSILCPTEGDDGDFQPQGTLHNPIKWQIVLSKALDLDNEMTKASSDTTAFDIDLFENKEESIKELGRRGKRVICYFSAGSFENWRSDVGEFKDDDLGNDLDGWPGERWLNISSPNVRRIMTQRIELAARKGCNSVDPDNVDGYENDNGLQLTQQDSIDYMAFLAQTAQSNGLLIGLKNAGSIVKDVIASVQFSVVEQCIKYSECQSFSSFPKNGEPVFHIEYPPSAPELTKEDKNLYCGHTAAGSGSEAFSTVLKTMNLDDWVYQCEKPTTTTCNSSSQTSDDSGSSMIRPLSNNLLFGTISCLLLSCLLL